MINFYLIWRNAKKNRSAVTQIYPKPIEDKVDPSPEHESKKISVGAVILTLVVCLFAALYFINEKGKSLLLANEAAESAGKDIPLLKSILTSFEHFASLPEHLSNQEVVLLVTLPLIAIYAVIRLMVQKFFSNSN